MNSIVKRSIDAGTGRRAIAAAAAKAVEMKKAMSIAITDESGALKAFERMNGASLLSIDIAINKAYTASSFGMPTHVWYEFIKDDPPLLHGITHTPRLVIFGGGFPIVEDGQVIGAIGVSGGHYTEDMEVARAALAAIGTAAG
ncbi:MAG: heme-binding protein [Lautropia sp.]